MMFFKMDDLYLPSTTVQNFNTLVWTERFKEAGDFKLIVDNEVSVLDTLPLGSLVSHTDTREVMIVENHEFRRQEKKTLEIEISGRSFETFAESRVTVGSYLPIESAPGVPNLETLTNISAEDIAVYLLQSTMQSGIASADDAIPNLTIGKVMRLNHPNGDHIIKRGQTYERVIEYLNACRSGIRNTRPLTSADDLLVHVHDGVDRLDFVTFYASNEDLDDSQYFWSNKNYRNFVAIAGVQDSRIHEDYNNSEGDDGLERRLVYEEASDLEDDYGVPAFEDIMFSRGQLVVDQYRKVELIQAKIAASAKPKFKIDYDVGDLVMVFGEFGIAQPMRVTEHILTVDKNGMRGYPSLNFI